VLARWGSLTDHGEPERIRTRRDPKSCFLAGHEGGDLLFSSRRFQSRHENTAD
jgi:hypothetical protein